MLVAKLFSNIFKKDGIILVDYSGQKIICGEPRKENPITHKWHTDSEILHKVALYHVNQNNGRTEFKDLGVSESEANSIVLFDGKIKHRSVTQTDAKIRVNININYV